MIRRLPELVLLALVSMGGCAGDGRAAREPLLVISGPEAFESFELRDHRDEVIWRLVADEPSAVERLVYGEIPAGFRQEAPATDAPPRGLLAGEPLYLESLTPRRLFRHWGRAEDGQRLSIDSWEMKLRGPPRPRAMDASPGAP